MTYAELHTTTNYGFLRGASHPEELVLTAKALGMAAIGITDPNSLAGVVRAWSKGKEVGIRVLTGARLDFADETSSVLCYPTGREAWGRLTRLLTVGQRRAKKGECHLTRRDPLCSPFFYAFFGHAYFLLGEDVKALTPLRECCSRTTDFSPGYVWLAAVCARLGREQEAEWAVAEVLRIRPTFTISQWRGMHPYRDKQAAEELYRWLGKARLPA